MKTIKFFITIIFLKVLRVTSNTKGDLDKPYRITFVGGTESESDLEPCQDAYSPCSLIQNPFFYPFAIKRLCRCKKKPCPDTFEQRRSYDTVFINNREQLKFCQDLPKCHGGWGVLHVGAENDIPYHLNCYCPAKRRYWRSLSPGETMAESQEETSIKLDDQLQDETEIPQVFRWKRTIAQAHDNSSSTMYNGVVEAIPLKLYKCEKMDKCSSQTCGTVRTDNLFATYQNCTCAPNSMCLPASATSMSITEVMNHDGLGKNTRCVRKIT